MAPEECPSVTDPITSSPQQSPTIPISLDGIVGGSGLQIRERSIDDKREDARKGLAYIIVGCFAATIVGSFLLFMTKGSASTDDVLKIIQAVIAPVSAIVGAVTGFYFSSNLNNGAGQRNTNQQPPP
jgi:hypothetical protein